MKRVLFFIMAAILCVTLMVAVSAETESPLIFVDATRRTPNSDFMEGFTLKNVSDKAVDLSDYKVWYGRTTSQEALNTLDPTTVTKFVMPLTDEVGKYIIEPGEMVYVWLVTSSVYKLELDTADGKVVLVEQGADGKPVYRIDNFRKAIEYIAESGTYRVTPIAEDMMVLPLDLTTGEAFGADGTYKNKPLHVNLQNSYYIRLYLSEYNARGAEEAFCTADLDGTGNGTYLNASGSVTCNYGTFTYKPVEGQVAMKVASFEAGTFLLGGEVQEEVVEPVEPAPEGAFRVMTINVLNDDYKTSRFGYIEKTVETLSPDIIGFQECREGFNSMIDNITKMGYVSALDTLSDDPLDNTIINCVKILYKTDKYTLVEDSAGARRFTEKYGDSWTKSMCYCVLEDNETKERIIVFNSHYAVYSSSYEGYTASMVEKQRESNAQEMLAQIEVMREKYGDLPVVAIGDYNMDEPERANRILQTALRDTAYLSDEAYPWMATYHKSLTGSQTGNYPIDHIYVSSEDFEVIRSLPYTASIGKKASDHYPLYADLRLSSNTNTSCADTHHAEAPLMIVDATRRTPMINGSGTSDTLEGFTVMNVSDKPVDLSHILVWYTTGKSEEAIDAIDPSIITFVMRLSERTGEYVLQPGEKAYIWNVYNTVYKTQGMTDEGLVTLVEQGDDGMPVYRTDNFRKVVAYLASNSEDEYTVNMIEDDTIIIPFDRTTRDAFGTDGEYRNLAKSFNFVNSAYIRLYLTYDTANGAEEAFCIADLDGTNDGTFIKEDGGVSVNFGTYKYLPGDGALMQTASFDKNGFPFGTDTEGFNIAAPEKTTVKLTIGSTTAYINGAAQTLDAAPINRNNRTMLPVRFLANAFGVLNDGIKWDADTRTATLHNSEVTIVVTIDAPSMTVNGETVALDSPAIIENNRTYLPVRAIANALGVSNDNIVWDGATSTATLTK